MEEFFIEFSLYDKKKTSKTWYAFKYQLWNGVVMSFFLQTKNRKKKNIKMKKTNRRKSESFSSSFWYNFKPLFSYIHRWRRRQRATQTFVHFERFYFQFLEKKNRSRSKIIETNLYIKVQMASTIILMVVVSFNISII